MTRFGKDLIAAMEQAAAHAQGKNTGMRVRHIPADSPEGRKGHDAAHRTRSSDTHPTHT